jgi:hypothetical protein
VKNRRRAEIGDHRRYGCEQEIRKRKQGKRDEQDQVVEASPAAEAAKEEIRPEQPDEGGGGLETDVKLVLPVGEMQHGHENDESRRHRSSNRRRHDGRHSWPQHFSYLIARPADRFH